MVSKKRIIHWYHKIFISSLLLQFLCFNTAHGQPFTLDQCLARAQKENLGIASYKAQEESKKALTDSALRDMLPTVSLSTTRTDKFYDNSGGSTAETFNTTLTVSQPVYHGGALWSSWKQAGLTHRRAKMGTSRARQTLIRDVKNAWISILVAELIYKESLSSLERLKIHEKNAQAFYEEGRYWRNEVLQAQVKTARGEQSVIEANNALSLAKSTMNRLLRRPLTADITLKGTLSWQNIPWKNIDEAFVFAKKRRLDLQQLVLDEKINTWAETETRADLLPAVDLTGKATWDATDSDYDTSTHKTQVAISASWTPWSWGKTLKDLSAAKATTRKSRYDRLDLLDEIQLEVRKTYLTAQESQKKVQVLEKALDQAEENYRVNQVRYQEQLGTATDVLNAQDLLTSTKQEYYQAMKSYLTALVELDYAVGRE
ncbi:TolC family protein [Magnetococcales bacterium HHB-1]